MLDARPHATAPAVRRPGRIPRRELVLWIVAGLLLNHFVHTVDIGTLDAFLVSLASQNIIFWFACFVIVRRVLDSDPATDAGTADIAAACGAAIALCVASLVGLRFGLGVLTTAVALHLLVVHRGDRPLRAAGAVLMALSVHLVWAQVVFRYFLPELLMADAAGVRALLAVIPSEVTAVDTTFYGPDGHTITLAGECSSFQNVSIAMLAAVSMIMLLRTGWQRRDALRIAAICAAMVATNVMRLAILAVDVESYLFWHEDYGAQIIAVAQTLLVGLLSWIAARAPSERAA